MIKRGNKRSTRVQTSYLNSQMVKSKRSNSRFDFNIENKQFIKSKRSQTAFGMSFEVIFSIILIIVFIALAIYVINHFLKLKTCTEIQMFRNDLQEMVDEVYKASSKSVGFSQPLPKQIQYICFFDFSKAINSNQDIYEDIKIFEAEEASMFFYPRKKACEMPYYDLKHINIEKITENQNPYCIKNNGNPVLKLSRNFDDILVNIE